MKALSAELTEVQPLSLEQMKKMGGQPYWHVGLQKDSPPPHWAILDPFAHNILKIMDTAKDGWPMLTRPSEPREKR